MTREQEVEYNIRVNKLIARVDSLEKENIRLREHIVFLKKNGYTYDTRKDRMILCDRCAKPLTGEWVPSGGEK